MNKFDRVTAILIQLQSKKVVKAQAIADRFEVSLRTVYRDIRTLENAGIPIIGEAGVGYSIMDGYRLPPVMFTEEEATAFLMAEKLLEKMVDNTTRTHFESAMFKVKSVLRSSEKETLENISEIIQVPDLPSAFISKIQNQYLQLVFQSVQSKEVLDLHYLKEYNKESSQRLIEPIGVYFLYDNWHMIAFCRTRNDYRDFRMDRIAKLVPTKKQFSKEHISIKDYLAKAEEHRTLHEVVVSFLKSTVQYAKTQKYYFGLVNEVEKGDRIEMTFLCSSMKGIAKWLLMFAQDIEIVSPETLKKEMKDLVSNLSDHYL